MEEGRLSEFEFRKGMRLILPLLSTETYEEVTDEDVGDLLSLLITVRPSSVHFTS